MKLIIFTLAALLHLCMGDSHNAICNSLYSEAPVDSPECIQEITDHLNEEGNVTCTMDTEITWIVIDPDAGIVTFELNLPPSSCRFEAYDLELNIDESISDPEMCTNASVVELHSRRYLTIKRHHEPNRILPDCDKVANITFHNVYSGCYILDIIPMLENRKKAKSETGEMLYQFKGPMFIHTNYTKTLLVNTFPYISTHYVESSNDFSVRIDIDSIEDLNVFVLIESDVMPSLGPKACIESGIMQTCCEHRNSGNVMCLNRSGSSLTPTCHVDKDDHVIWCYLHNVTTPGYYCVLVQFIDDRCEPYTVWYNESTKNKCLFSSRIAPIPIPNATSSTGPVPIPGTPGHVINILISVFVVVGLILIGVFIYLWRKRKPGLDIEPYSEKQFPMQQKPRILLLYALDCKPFMTLMATFREVLKDATKCEVYDCFDPKLSEEIARNKTDWLRHRIATSKVIVVESKCAVLHQNALLKQGKVMYKEPVSNCLDDLFVYGLKALTDNCFGTYEKIFVVRINGFSELKDELKHITPYSRYTIPQHMEKLLTSLYQLRIHDYESRFFECTTNNLKINYPGYELCNTDENVDIRMLKLYECILNLENYKTGTPDYLDMLFVKESDQEV